MSKHLAEQFPLPLAQPAPPSEAPQAHHEFGMSTLNYLAACAGFKGRSGDNEAAQDGTRLHGVMETVIKSLNLFHVEQNSALTALRRVLETETVSEDEEFYLEFCCRELDKWLPKIKPGAEALQEQRVYIRNPDGSDLNFGHYDLLLFLSGEAALIFDWKFGWVPVPSAEANWQGKGYAVGVFQAHPRIAKLGVVFVQPKLHWATHTLYNRADLYSHYAQVRDVIARAQAPEKVLKPGKYCDFCASAATCSALLNEASRAVALYEGLPVPAGFAGLQITTPQDAARAMFVLDRLEVLIDRASELKDLAKTFARDNGGILEAPLPDGRIITVELKTKSAARSANSPGLIAECLKEWLSPEQVLAACDPKITTLETIFADAFVARQRAEAQALLGRAESEARKLEHSGDPKGAAQVRENARAEAKAIRVTKKHAVEILNATLQAEGLVSRPEARVEYLKTRVETPVKHITQND